MRLIKMNGLNKRTIAVRITDVLFLEEAEVEGNMVTNIHFGNGRWVTAVHPLDEVGALLDPQSDESQKAESKKQVDRWREMARARREAQIEVDEALRQIGPKLKAKSYSKEQFPDGSGVLTVMYEPVVTDEPSSS